MDESTSTPKRTKHALGLLVLALIALSSCSGKKLRPDAVALPATAANYHTAEFTACGQLFYGIGICPLISGQSLDNVALAIQGYYQGTVRVVTDCRTDNPPPDSMRYSINEKVPYHLAGEASQSCLVSFVVSPEYPNEDSSGIVIHSFEGHLWIRVLNANESFVGYTMRVAEGADPQESVSIAGVNVSVIQVVFESQLCHVQPNVVTLPVGSDGILTIPLKSFMPVVDVQTCVMNGVAFLPAGPLRLTWFIDGYDSRFVPMPIPALTIKNGKLQVSGDNNTSVVSLDSSYEIDKQAEFNFDSTKAHILRLLTVGGRSILGQFDSAQGKWSWMY